MINQIQQTIWRRGLIVGSMVNARRINRLTKIFATQSWRLRNLYANTDIIDGAFKRLELLLIEVEKFADTLLSESDTRLKIIDPILMEVLGWQKADILTEEPAGIGHGETKTDYISKVDLIGYLCAMGFERRAVAMWLDALLKRALLLNYDPTCVDEQNATQLEISPTGELHLFWGQSEFEYLFAVAETTPVRDESSFTEMRLAYNDRWKDRSRAVIANFLRYLMNEDQVYCRMPDHESYSGQVRLIQKLEASAQYFDGAFRK